MIRQLTLCLLALATLVCRTISEASWQDNGIDPEALIAQILSVDQQQHEQIHDLVCDAEYLVGKWEKDGTLKVEKRFEKQLYLLLLSDTTLYREDYVAYYKDDKLESEEELAKQAKEQKEKRKERRSHHIGFPMLRPFYTEHRPDYEIQYVGVADELIDGNRCHQFRVTALVEDKEHLSGTYYFEAESFHPVRVEFHPAELSGNIGFKLKQMNMTLQYEPTDDGYWLPKRFELSGKGKAIFLIGVSFGAVERYSNLRINTGLTQQEFETSDEQE